MCIWLRELVGAAAVPAQPDAHLASIERPALPESAHALPGMTSVTHMDPQHGRTEQTRRGGECSQSPGDGTSGS